MTHLDHEHPAQKELEQPGSCRDFGDHPERVRDSSRPLC